MREEDAVKRNCNAQKNWRCLPVIGLMILLTGCVTATHPPCATPQRLARLRQEHVLRSSITKRRRALVATRARLASLQCQSRSSTHHTLLSCQTLLRHSQSLVAQIQREEAQLEHLLNVSYPVENSFGQASCAAAPQPASTHGTPRHRSKHPHHKAHSSAPAHSHHKAHAPVAAERSPADQPVDPTSAIAEVPKSPSLTTKQNTDIPAQLLAPQPAPAPPEHDYVVDPHMRVIGRSFFQDDVKLHNDPSVP